MSADERHDGTLERGAREDRTLLRALGLVLGALGLGALLSAAACAGLGKAAGDITYAVTGDESLRNVAQGLGGAAEALGPIGLEEEKAIGGAVAVKIANDYGGEYMNPTIRQYVATLGKAIAIHSDRSDVDYHFMVLHDSAPNAFAAPGGYVFITSGTIRACKNEAELAGVLGHEIAHVTQRHALEVLARGKALQGLAQAGAGALEQDPKMFAGIADEVIATILEKGLDQDKELEADALGVEYASRLGYEPRGLQSFLRTLGGIVGYRNSALFKTHPDPATRVDELDDVLGGYRSLFGGATVESRFQQMKRRSGLG